MTENAYKHYNISDTIIHLGNGAKNELKKENKQYNVNTFSLLIEEKYNSYIH